MKSQNANLKKINVGTTKGITLITLVITIIILIILSGVAIYLVLGSNGIIKRTKQAKEETNKQTATEIINLKITTAQINSYTKKQQMPTLKELSEELKKDSEIQYVTEKSKVASAEYNVTSENPSSIFTKLNQYPYEFEINSSLQLATINGVKVATNNSNDQEIKPCNPKLLTTMQLTGSTNDIREPGDYYANTNIFAKTNATEFSKYLSFNDETGWQVLKSGYYRIYSKISIGWVDKYVEATNYLLYNTDQMEIACAAANSKVTEGSETESSTIFLEKGTNINFKNTVYSTGNGGNNNWVAISIYALFN